MIAVTSKQMREMDRKTIDEAGIPGWVLMDRAGRGVARHIRWLLDETGFKKPSILLLAGRGNNGGDALVAARVLHEAGYRVDIWLFTDPADMQEDAFRHYKLMHDSGVPCRVISNKEAWNDAIGTCSIPDVIVDGLLGTGAKGAPRGLLSDAVKWIIKQSGHAYVVAVDIPSGLDADTGIASDIAVRADLTVTLAAPKAGMLKASATPYTGSVEVVDIGIPEEFLTGQDGPQLICAGELSRLFPDRPCESHKGSFGHVLIIGGAHGYSGAVSLAAAAAVRSGAGLVSAIVPKSIAQTITAVSPETMVHGTGETDAGSISAAGFKEQLNFFANCSAILIGPGMTTHPETLHIVETVLEEAHVPVVLDADALNALAGKLEIIKAARGPVIITPHPGEMARLLNTTSEAIQHDRDGSCLKAAELTGATVVLKGAGTLVAEPNGPLFINLTGNPGMATGGTGDVLAGLTAGLTAQKIIPIDAAKAAVYLHGKAGDAAALCWTQQGMKAGDIINALPAAIRMLTPR